MAALVLAALTWLLALILPLASPLAAKWSLCAVSPLWPGRSDCHVAADRARDTARTGRIEDRGQMEDRGGEGCAEGAGCKGDGIVRAARDVGDLPDVRVVRVASARV